MQTYTYRIRALKGLDKGAEANQQKSTPPSDLLPKMNQWGGSVLAVEGNDNCNDVVRSVGVMLEAIDNSDSKKPGIPSVGAICEEVSPGHLSPLPHGISTVCNDIISKPTGGPHNATAEVDATSNPKACTHGISRIGGVDAASSSEDHGYEVQLVLEYCDLGSLREVLDAGVFIDDQGRN
eukprot:167123-Chlamydomonas_euryale.AAC.1